MILRPYQSDAVAAAYRHLRSRTDNPVIVIPTGGGKTPVIATICSDAVTKWGGRVLVLAHVKELLEQTASKLAAICPGVEVGVHSAGLGRKELGKAVTVAGIQSLYRKACDLGKVDLILVDEAHLIPPDGEGMYRKFLTDCQVVNPHVRVIGLTATPFRTGSGDICDDSHFLNAICYDIEIPKLIADGFLSPITAKAGQGGKVDFTKIKKTAGEFSAHETELAMDREEITSSAVAEIVSLTADRKSVLIFAAGLSHAGHVKAEIEKLTGDECGFISGETPDGERANLIGRFRSDKVGMFAASPLKYLVNVNVLTTGFDAPNVDCVVLLRPTMSPGLFYQMVGRGFRIAPGKANCLVLDYGGNTLRHGPVDKLNRPKKKGMGRDDVTEAPSRECPQCHSILFIGYAVCPDCGHEFPQETNEKMEASSSGEPVLSGEIIDSEWPVTQTDYCVHTKRGAGDDAPKTMRVIYRTSVHESYSEWICIEHQGWAKSMAKKWWEARSDHPFPTTASEAVDLANAGVLANPTKVYVRSVSGDHFPKVLRVDCDEKPDPYLKAVDTDDVPF